MSVNNDNAGGDLVERASQDSRFPSELAESELNFGRSANRFQQLVQTLKVRWGKRVCADPLVNAKKDSM